MAYRDFSLTTIIADFQLIETYCPLFLDLVPIAPSHWLLEALEMGRRLVLPGGNEKARSEFLIAPILLELERHYRDRLAIYSGQMLNADSEHGLVGECDFLLARGPGGLTVRSPILTVVEAKRDDIDHGIGQCVAQMVGAQIVNQRDRSLPFTNADSLPADPAWGTIFGCVTTGEIWQFLRLMDRQLTIDRDRFYLVQIEQILAAFHHGLDHGLNLAS